MGVVIIGECPSAIAGRLTADAQSLTTEILSDDESDESNTAQPAPDGADLESGSPSLDVSSGLGLEGALTLQPIPLAMAICRRL